MTTLYHYCSTKAFIDIIQSKSIWLSSLLQSNDSQEGQLVRKTLLRHALRDGLEATATIELEKHLAKIERMIDGLGFCLSSSPDLLSQWRGYADDGSGVAIGFNKTYLSELANASNSFDSNSFGLLQVKYAESEHDDLLSATYQKLKREVEQGALRRNGRIGLLDDRSDEELMESNKQEKEAYTQFIGHLFDSVWQHLFVLKSLAFQEEQEWRLLSIRSTGLPGQCKFRVSGKQVVPYRVVSFGSQLDGAICEVILGPKHPTPPNVVRSLLESFGFEMVAVRHSSASYR